MEEADYSSPSEAATSPMRSLEANDESPQREEMRERVDSEDAPVNDAESEGEQSEGEGSASEDDYFSTHPSAINEPWYIRHPELVDAAAEDADDEADELNDSDYEPVVDERFKGPPFVPPSQRDDAPLASILQNPELDKIDPRRFFPEYSQDGILRFSRIFGSNIKSASRTKIWWPLKNFRGGSPTADDKKDKDEGTGGVEGTSEEKAGEDKEERKREELEDLELEIGPPPPPEECQVSDEVLLMRPSNLKAVGKEHSGDADDDNVPPWRYGPARIWYDRMNVPANPTHFDYGFKLKREKKPHAKSTIKEEKVEDESEKGLASCDPFPPETFLLVNLVRWEDDIIIDGEQARAQVLKRLASGRQPEYGWVPTQQTRSYESFMAALKSNAFEQMFAKPGTVVPTRAITDLDFPKEPTPSHSIFPMDNYELINTRWEDDIIWDSENMDHIPEPHVLTLDYHDDPKIFGMPEDKAPEEKPPDGEGVAQPKPFDRKEHQFTKKSKMILGQVQQRQKQEEDEQMESSVAQLTDKDPFNLSNDEYYLPKNTGRTVSSISSGSLIQHSIPAQNIHRTFFPTHLNPFKLRHYHRLPLPKRILRTTGTRYVPVKTLTKLIKEKEELREKQKAAEGGGEIFFMREVEDLSGKDGTLLLMEYSEEHPPLLNQPGMASKIRNYYKRKVGKEADPEYEFGETAFTHTSPFLGSLAPGQSLQSLENNLYRAPIYRHEPARTDFLLIRTKQGFFIRRCPTLFLVGQECPLYEVPSPNSKRATVFVRDFLLAYIYRLFWASDQIPRRLKMEDIKAAFPHYAESSVRKRLKQCSDFKRLGQGPDQNYWVLRSDFRLPSKEEVLAMVTPEMCCAQYSMLAAEQRLKDAGYGEKYFFTPENEDDSDDQVTIEDEIKCAPWNTTRAYISSMKGKCLLDQTGIADPTGCGEGFSYVRVSAKPQKAKEEVPNVPKRLVTGTNADLRKLPLKEAKEICRDYGVREEEINSLSRWEIIDVIRTLSTQAAKARSDFSGMARFARGNIRFNFADMQEKYKKFCQRIFDLQNQTLSNPDQLSTDEGSSGEDSDNEELATKLESMLAANKGKKGLSAVERKKLEFEQEEKERKALQKMLSGDVSAGTSTPKPEKEQGKESQKESSVVTEDSNHTMLSGNGPRKLKIYRTFKGPDGIESTRVEVITRPQLIEAYVRIRTTRDNTFIQVYAQMDEQYKEERRKEKRRLQDQLRRIRRNELKAKLHGVPIGQPINKAKPAAEKKPVVIKPNLLKMRCSACHGTGHMKTNKNCPLYGKDSSKAPTKTVGDIHPVALTDEQLEKMAVPSGELIAVEGTKLKISRKLYAHTEMIKKNAVRLHIPRELIAGEKKGKEEDEMSTATGGEPEEGMVHGDDDVDTDDDHQVGEVASNSKSRTSVSTSSSRRRSTVDMDDYLYGPQKSVQRRRADPRVSMSIQLNEIFGELRALPGTEHLMFPVNAKKVPDYYTIIKNPMDMQAIKKKISENKYELRRQFLADIKQMLDNSRVYNGDNHVITETARKVFEVASVRLMEREPKLIALEKAINPLLDDNDIIGFSFILNEIIQECKNLPKSVAFHTKVDAKKVPLYYKKIERPMDLGTMEQNIKEHRYTTVEAFRKDILQIKINSELYNGPPETSQYTTKAIEICELAERMLEARKEQLSELEANIQATLNESAEVESVAASSAMDEGEMLSPAARFANIKEEDIEDEEDEIVDHLQDDLALSGDEDEMDDEDHELGSNWDPTGEMSLSGYDAENDLLQSQMHTSGQLNADLALSDSDEDDDDQFISAKRPKLEDLTTL
ncbi:Transcription initiation factor TFIID subunit 1 [Toxocara canis]|uniref:Transcription initiation factor TFIID subunit 1 n=1 Tax=Toxocara canis TaxID=6265 RepID=A0A0B2VLI3_TOXCA|nr:Transcription initiation factor TFIID subunit 1 [Toxocara canis]